MSRLALCSGRDLLQHDRFHRPNYRSLALRQTVIGWILAVILALAPWALPAAHAQPAGAQLDQSLAKTAGAFVPGRVLVGWNDLANKENAVASMRRQGWTVLRTLDPLPVALVEVPAGKELEAIALLEADPAVAYAETDALAFAPGAPASSLRLQRDGWRRRAGSKGEGVGLSIGYGWIGLQERNRLQLFACRHLD